MQPYNTVERVFAVGCLVSGMLFSSSLAAAIAASTIQYYKNKGDKTHKFMMLRRFLHRKSINSKIGVQVRNRQKTR